MLADRELDRCLLIAADLEVEVSAFAVVCRQTSTLDGLAERSAEITASPTTTGRRCSLTRRRCHAVAEAGRSRSLASSR
jgi:hypothetical protein